MAVDVVQNAQEVGRRRFGNSKNLPLRFGPRLKEKKQKSRTAKEVHSFLHHTLISAALGVLVCFRVFSLAPPRPNVNNSFVAMLGFSPASAPIAACGVLFYAENACATPPKNAEDPFYPALDTSLPAIEAGDRTCRAVCTAVSRLLIYSSHGEAWICEG